MDLLKFAYCKDMGLMMQKSSSTSGTNRYQRLTEKCRFNLCIQHPAAPAPILTEELHHRFHLPKQIIYCIINFLTNRSQRVLVNNTLSDLIFTSGPLRVLSPLLLILYLTKWLCVINLSMLMTQISCPCSQAALTIREQHSSSLWIGATTGGGLHYSWTWGRQRWWWPSLGSRGSCLQHLSAQSTGSQ